VKESRGFEMANCKEPDLSDIFPFYLTGDLSPEETKKIERHVSSCAACQKKLSFFMTVSECGLPSWRRAPGSGRNGVGHFHR
jgi:hypothetical protein